MRARVSRARDAVPKPVRCDITHSPPSVPKQDELDGTDFGGMPGGGMDFSSMMNGGAGGMDMAQMMAGMGGAGGNFEPNSFDAEEGDSDDEDLPDLEVSLSCRVVSVSCRVCLLCSVFFACRFLCVLFGRVRLRSVIMWLGPIVTFTLPLSCSQEDEEPAAKQ